MLKSFLFTCPMEEFGRRRRIILNFQNFRYESRCNAAELIELGDDEWAPIIPILSEDVENEACEGRNFRVLVNRRNRWS